MEEIPLWAYSNYVRENRFLANVNDLIDSEH